MKLTVGTPLGPRLHRKAVKGIGIKRPAGAQPRVPSVAGRTSAVDPCENSNDSGLGFDHHLDYHLAPRPTVRYVDQETTWANDHPEAKRKKLEIKLETDDANDNFSFPEMINKGRKEIQLPGSTMTSAAGEAGRTVQTTGGRGLGGGLRAPGQRAAQSARPLTLAGRRANLGPVSLLTPLAATTVDGRIQLHILCQPEQQHRARYQTEGSRGAVKDRTGNSFPVVKLIGYNKPATLQVFIGTDMGRVAPHMFYQACRVSGKNSTPCTEKKIDGTVVIEVDFDPAKDMVITCDCVGILKERNVDVEHRFPDQSGTRNKKKSTRCRMVFRTTITHEDGSTEVLQVASQPIVCTQPPGVPEICKKSSSAVTCSGGVELFILGKNFLKDSRVLFQEIDTEPCWEESVQPDKEFLQQTHLVCTVPPYRRLDIVEPVTVKLAVVSSGKMSEPHTFTYLPITNPVVAAALHAPVRTPELGQPCATLLPAGVPQSAIELSRVYGKSAMAPSAPSLMMPPQILKNGPVITDLKSQILPVDASRGTEGKPVVPVMMWACPGVNSSQEEKKLENEQKMPPPALLPLMSRRLSANAHIAMAEAQVANLKTERLDELTGKLKATQYQGMDLSKKSHSAAGSMGMVTDLSATQSPNMAAFCQFVSQDTSVPLPAQTGQSVEKFLSRIENTKDSRPTLAAYEARETDGSNGAGVSVQLVRELADEKPLSQFGGSRSSIFEGSQQQRLLNARETSQKVSFVSGVPLSSVYSSREAEKLDACPLPETVSVTQTQAVGQAGSQSLQEVLSKSSPLREAVTHGVQSHTVQETLTQSRPLTEAMVQNVQCHSLRDALTQSQTLQEAVLQNAQSQSLPEALKQSIKEAVVRSQSLEETLNRQQSLHEAAIRNAQSQSLQEALKETQSLEEAISRNTLLAVGALNPEQKQVFEESPVREIHDRQTLGGSITSASRVSPPADSRVNANGLPGGFHGAPLSRQNSEAPLTVQEIFTTLPEQRVMMHTSPSLIFCGSQQQSSGSPVCSEVKSGSPLIESLTNGSQSHSPISETQLMETGHSSAIRSRLPSTDGGVGVQSSSPRANEGILLNHEQSSLMATAGLRALASAMDNQFGSSTEKLDAIVNSAADSHMGTQNATAASVNGILGSQIQPVSGNEHSSSVLVDSMRMESSLPPGPNLNAFNLNPLGSVQNSVQMSRENMMLSDAVSAAIDEHLSRQSAERKESEISSQSVLVENNLPPATVSLSIDTSSVTDSVLMKSPHTSPIAVKNIILSPPPTTSVDNHVLVSSPISTSPIAVKTMILNSPIESEVCMTSATSPVAVKSILLDTSPTERQLHTAVSVHAPGIAMKEIINSQISGSDVASGGTSPVGALNSESNTMQLANNSPHSTPSVTMSSPALCSLLNHNNNSTLVGSSSPIQEPQLIVTRAGSSCMQSQVSIAISTAQMQEAQSRQEASGDILSQVRDAAASVLAQQVQQTTMLNSIYNSGNQQQHTVNFSGQSSVIIGRTADGCPVTVTQTEPLNSATSSKVEMPVGDLLGSKALTDMEAERKNQIADNCVLSRLPETDKSTDATGSQSSTSDFTASNPKVLSKDQYPCGTEMKPDGSGTAANGRPQETAPLPLPVTEISSGAPVQPKILPNGPVQQKKCEEGMVPQELTQMSESDLISYINPSCFDQV